MVLTHQAGFVHLSGEEE